MISKLRELLEAATPGPWYLAGSSDDPFIAWKEDPEYDAEIEGHGKNVKLIVEMRNQLPALIDRLEKLEAVAEAARVMRKAASYDIALAKRNFDTSLAALEEKE